MRRWCSCCWMREQKGRSNQIQQKVCADVDSQDWKRPSWTLEEMSRFKGVWRKGRRKRRHESLKWRLVGLRSSSCLDLVELMVGCQYPDSGLDSNTRKW